VNACARPSGPAPGASKSASHSSGAIVIAAVHFRAGRGPYFCSNSATTAWSEKSISTAPLWIALSKLLRPATGGLSDEWMAAWMGHGPRGALPVVPPCDLHQPTGDRLRDRTRAQRGIDVDDLPLVEPVPVLVLGRRDLGQLLPVRDDLLAHVVDVLLVLVGDVAAGQQTGEHRANGEKSHRPVTAVHIVLRGASAPWRGSSTGTGDQAGMTRSWPGRMRSGLSMPLASAMRWYWLPSP
jgi:hypothetical protein